MRTIAEKAEGLQQLMESLNSTCKKYGIELNAKMTKEIRARIGMAMNVFYQHKELIDRNITLQTKIQILSLYILPVAAYESECWTMNKEAQRRITALVMWCLRRMLKTSWKDKVKKVVLEKANSKDRWLNQIARRKMKFAGHVLRDSAEDLELLVLEGLVEGKRDGGRQRGTCFDNIREWARAGSYVECKRKAEERGLWRPLQPTIGWKTSKEPGDAYLLPPGYVNIRSSITTKTKT
ncbi:uncharacterized protein LOC134787067 [Penaeus indicus]|uniref:uncharacterized protein LOC134787067 n=1 Tax=Penaeus indicus TaxID=29960 RepID=UPI00300C2CCC